MNAMAIETGGGREFRLGARGEMFRSRRSHPGKKIENVYVCVVLHVMVVCRWCSGTF